MAVHGRAVVERFAAQFALVGFVAWKIWIVRLDLVLGIFFRGLT